MLSAKRKCLHGAGEEEGEEGGGERSKKSQLESDCGADTEEALCGNGIATISVI